MKPDAPQVQEVSPDRSVTTPAARFAVQSKVIFIGMKSEKAVTLVTHIHNQLNDR